MEPEPSGFDDPKPVPGTGEEAFLTFTEARLWEVLRSQPGRAFRRSELVALVMPEAVVLERTIDVHIRALRRKLGTVAGQIETVRKVGYRFTPNPGEKSESLG